MNYSFWADEAYIAGVAVQWATGQLSLLSAFNSWGMTYQKLQIIFIGVLFKIFGYSEFIARLPSLIAFLIGIIMIFFIAKKLSNLYGGIMSALLFGFSHLNLSYAFQAKPYSMLETITLAVILLIEVKNEKKLFYKHLVIIALLCIATLLHTIGVLIWILYLVFLISKVIRLKTPNLKHIITLISAFVIIIAIIAQVISTAPSYIFFKLFPYNNSYQVIKLFAYKYTLITIPAVIGYIWLLKHKRTMSIALFLYSIIVLVLAMFQQYIFNIRYVLSLFGILFLYFGIFWAKVGEKYDDNFKFKIFNLKLSGKALIPLVVIVLLYTTGYKIVRWPQAYYNPNIDKYGDVQIANYKDFYAELKQKFPGYKNMYVVNDTFDAEYWYFGRYSNAYFMKFVTKPYQHQSVKNTAVYGSLEDFKKIMKEHPQGLLIMEDWQSFLPDDIKMYAKKNLKLELRVESLKEATDDPWPLALYSWGLK